MARKTVILTPEGAVVPDLGPDAFPVFTMPNDVASRSLIPWRGGVPSDFSALNSVELIIISQNTGNLYLNLGATRFDLSTPSRVTSSSSGYAAYAGGDADSKTKYVPLPSTMWDSISEININDAFNFYVDRDASYGADTYEEDLLIVGLRVMYTQTTVGAEEEAGVPTEAAITVQPNSYDIVYDDPIKLAFQKTPTGALKTKLIIWRRPLPTEAVSASVDPILPPQFDKLLYRGTLCQVLELLQIDEADPVLAKARQLYDDEKIRVLGILSRARRVRKESTRTLKW
jgi:hypothetical protein